MKSFINNIISRHIEVGKNVTPRLRTKFEPPAQSPDILTSDFGNSEIGIAHDTANLKQAVNPKQFIEELPPRFPGIEKAKTVPANDGEHEKTGTLLSSGNILGQNNDHTPLQISEQETGKIDNDPEIKKHPDQRDTGWISKELPLDSGQHEKYLVITNYLSNEPLPKGEKEVIITSDTTTKIDAAGSTADPSPTVTHKIKPVLKIEETVSAASKRTGILGEPISSGIYNAEKKNGNSFSNYAEAETTQVIKVSIGQIHVRAINQPANTSKTPMTAVKKPALTLDNYLKERGR